MNSRSSSLIVAILISAAPLGAQEWQMNVDDCYVDEDSETSAEAPFQGRAIFSGNSSTSTFGDRMLTWSGSATADCWLQTDEEWGGTFSQGDSMAAAGSATAEISISFYSEDDLDEPGGLDVWITNRIDGSISSSTAWEEKYYWEFESHGDTEWVNTGAKATVAYLLPLGSGGASCGGGSTNQAPGGGFSYSGVTPTDGPNYSAVTEDENDPLMWEWTTRSHYECNMAFTIEYSDHFVESGYGFQLCPAVSAQAAASLLLLTDPNKNSNWERVACSSKAKASITGVSTCRIEPH